MSYYLHNTFFNTYHRFEGGDGKRQRDALAEKFSFLVSVGSDVMSNAEKREAKSFNDDALARIDAAAAVRDNFATTCGAILFAGRSREAPSTYATFSEKFANTFRKITELFTTNDETVKDDASALDGAE